MESRVNYTVVGLFVVSMSIAFVIIFVWLSALREREHYNTYVVYFKENVTGLAEQSQVRYNGVPVGYVESFSLAKQDPQYVRIVMKIDQGVPITTSTVATLYFQGITGVLYVGLTVKKPGMPLLKALPGEKYPVIAAQPSLLVQISEAIPQITDSVKKVGESVTQLLDETNITAVRNSLQNVQKFTKVLADNDKKINEIMDSLNITVKNTAKATQDLPNVMSNLNKTLESVRNTSLQVNLTVNTTRKTMEEGRVMIENFSDQVMPVAQQALSHVSEAAGNLQHLTGELQRNPSMILRGKQADQPGPGEQ